MPTPNHPPHPTDGELAILRVLWTKGPSTVRQILPHLPENTRYTTALKLLQIMYEKHLVTRDEQNRTHIYSPAQKPEATQRRILKDLIDRAFSGSAGQLVMQALSAKRATPDELAAIRRLLDQHAQQNKKGEAP